MQFRVQQVKIRINFTQRDVRSQNQVKYTCAELTVFQKIGKKTPGIILDLIKEHLTNIILMKTLNYLLKIIYLYLGSVMLMDIFHNNNKIISPWISFAKKK